MTRLYWTLIILNLTRIHNSADRGWSIAGRFLLCQRSKQILIVGPKTLNTQTHTVTGRECQVLGWKEKCKKNILVVKPITSTPIDNSTKSSLRKWMSIRNIVKETVEASQSTLSPFWIKSLLLPHKNETLTPQ